MQFIKFEVELRGQLDVLNAEWRRSLREEPDELLTLHAEVWGPSEGTMLSRSYPTGFIAFLEKRRFPFRE